MKSVEDRREYMKAYALANKAKLKTYYAVYAAANREKLRANAKKHYYSHPEKHARHREYSTAYRNTPHGYLRGKYRSMAARVEGRCPRPYLWQGLSILPLDEFMTWAKASSDFQALFDAWLAAGKPMQLSPSIDRINPAFGYEIWNMQFITHGQNASKAGLQRYHGAAAA